MSQHAPSRTPQNLVSPTIEVLENRRMFSAVSYDTFVPQRTTDDDNIIALDGKKLRAVPGEWIVTLEQPLRRGLGKSVESLNENVGDYAIRTDWLGSQAAAAELGLDASVVKGGKYLGDARYLRVSLSMELSSDEQFDLLRRLPGVAGVEPDLVGDFASTTPNDPYAIPGSTNPPYSQQWLQIIKAYDAWTTP